jgi:quercetin dioxygenase-like cupin family protein
MYHKPTSTENATKLPIAQDAWLLFRFKNHELIRLHLGPGESIENHINEWRLLFFVLRGSGTLNVEGKIFQMEAEQSIVIKPGKERFWTNNGEGKLELLAIKTEGQE